MIRLYPCGHTAEADGELPRHCPLCSRHATATPRRTPGKMNKLEERYAKHLDALKLAGEVSDWWFEKIAIRIGERGFWHPDFLVHLSSGLIELHDTKGHVKDDALVKAKAVAEQLPFGVVHVQWVKGAWKFRRIGR